MHNPEFEGNKKENKGSSNSIGNMEKLINTGSNKIHEEKKNQPEVYIDRVHKAVIEDMKIFGSTDCIFFHKSQKKASLRDFEIKKMLG
jgi:hypothetical protein